MDDHLLDLSPQRARPLLEAALERRHADRLLAAADPFLAALPAEASGLGRLLLTELARQAAQLDRLAQQAAAAALSREDRLRIDPLRAIPAERLAAAAGPAPEPEPGPVEIAPDDPALGRFGWWPLDRTADGPLLWSGAAPAAALLLPALGGGALRLTLTLRAPFGVPLDPGAQDWFLDGVPLAFRPQGDAGRVVAEAHLPPLPAGARMTLLLQGPQHHDPATGPGRDPRRLGLGLVAARVERA